MKGKSITERIFGMGTLLLALIAVVGVLALATCAPTPQAAGVPPTQAPEPTPVNMSISEYQWYTYYYVTGQFEEGVYSQYQPDCVGYVSGWKCQFSDPIGHEIVLKRKTGRLSELTKMPWNYFWYIPSVPKSYLNK